MPLINYEVNLIPTWSENWVLSDMAILIVVREHEENQEKPAINSKELQQIQNLRLMMLNWMYQLLLYQFKMIIKY